MKLVNRKNETLVNFKAPFWRIVRISLIVISLILILVAVADWIRVSILGKLIMNYY